MTTARSETPINTPTHSGATPIIVGNVSAPTPGRLWVDVALTQRHASSSRAGIETGSALRWFHLGRASGGRAPNRTRALRSSARASSRRAGLMRALTRRIARRGQVKLKQQVASRSLGGHRHPATHFVIQPGVSHLPHFCATKPGSERQQLQSHGDIPPTTRGLSSGISRSAPGAAA
jgi:hypothetical protein